MIIRVILGSSYTCVIPQLQVTVRDSKGCIKVLLYIYIHIWASPEIPMWKFLYKTTTAGLKDLPRKLAMVCAKGTLDFREEVILL